MASRLYDAFGRNATSTPGALGLSDSGHAYIDLFGGAVSIVNNAARVDTGPAAGAAVVLDAGAFGSDGDLGVALLGKGAGLGLYFRAVDAANWWRAFQRVYTYTYQSSSETYVSGYTEVYSHTETYLNHYEQVAVGSQDSIVGYNYTTTWNNRDGFGNIISSDRATNNYPTPGYPSPVLSEPFPGSGYYVADVGYSNSPFYQGNIVYEYRPVFASRAVYVSQPVYATRAVYSTATGYDLWLEKRVNGGITTVAQRQITGPFTGLRVRLRGDKIEVYVAGQATPLAATDSTHIAATKHGFGRGKPTEQENSNTDLIDDFYFNPVTTGSLQPPVLL